MIPRIGPSTIAILTAAVVVMVAFIDTFIYRAGDMLGGWAPTWLAVLGGWLQMASPIPNWTLWLPLSLLWIAVAIALGRMLRRIGSAAVSNPETPGPGALGSQRR